MMVSNLKPCPFCGREKLIRVTVKTCFIVCEGCETQGPVENTLDDAIEAWNTRTEMMSKHSSNEVIKMLRDQVQYLQENKRSMDEASWQYQEGILITGNEAIELLKRCSE